MSVFVNGARWLSGAFTGLLSWTPTANRTLSLPDETGTLATTAAISTAITNATRPAVEATRSSTQSIAVSGFTRLICNVVNLDTNSAYNSTTGVFTVPTGQGGLYEFLVFTGFTSPGNNIQIIPVRNGFYNEPARSTAINLTHDGFFWISHTAKIRLNAGDTLAFDVFYSSVSGTAVTTSATQVPSVTINRVY